MKALLSLTMVLGAALAMGQGRPPRVVGVTICPSDPLPDWSDLRANPEGALRELRGTFDGLRIMDDFDMPGPQSIGLGVRAKRSLAITRMALDMGFKEVLLAINGPFVGAYTGSKYLYPLDLVCQQYGLWVKEVQKMPGAERVRFINNDSGLVSTLRSMPSKSQALDPEWARKNVVTAKWVTDRKPVAKYLRVLYQYIWKVNPNQKLIVQDFAYPLGLTDPRLEFWSNAYYPLMMNDHPGKFTWPMKFADKDRIVRSLGIARDLRDYDSRGQDYSDNGMLQYLKEFPMDGASESGLPNTTPWPTYKAWLRSMIRANILLNRSWYLFYSEVLRTPGKTASHYDPNKLVAIQNIIRSARAEAGKR